MVSGVWEWGWWAGRVSRCPGCLQEEKHDCGGRCVPPGRGLGSPSGVWEESRTSYVFVAVWGVSVGAAEARPVSVPRFPHHYRNNNAVHLPGLEGVGLSQPEDPEPAGCVRVGMAPHCWGRGRGRGRRTPESGVAKDSSGKWTEAPRPGSEPWAARPGFRSCRGPPGSSHCPSHRPVGLTVGLLGQQGDWSVDSARLQPPCPPSFGRQCAHWRRGWPCGSVGSPGLGLGGQGLRCGGVSVGHPRGTGVPCRGAQGWP